ncbi:MAG: DUF2961 domain-containing protein [Candidatus Thermoplasmatota archaeon]|nr:DUF2961 domain-containing protein [Candidatus Thermoplasmatota archaeon]
MKRFLSVGMVLLMVFTGLAGCVGDENGSKNTIPEGAEWQVYGLEAAERFDLLPYLKQGVTIGHVSSHAKDGGNLDGGTYDDPSGNETYLYKEGSSYVIMDAKGPGCITRIWMTKDDIATVGNIQIYFDDEKTPRVDVPADKFFSGSEAPFLFPLAGFRNVSSGGHYCYLPMAFKTRCKFVLTGAPNYYNIDYHLYPAWADVETFTGKEDYSKLISMWKNCGADPKPTDGNVPIDGTADIASGGVKEILSINGAGSITAFKIKLDSVDVSVLNNLWIDMYWDGVHCVNAPVGEFFGCGGLGAAEVKSLPLGYSSSDGWFYCYWPMPYSSSATIFMSNAGTSSVKVDYRVEYNTKPYEGLGSICSYFNANWRQETTAYNYDYLILETSGKGHYVGVTHTLRGIPVPVMTLFMEGDERVYIDGSRSPAMYGTGTEDYYNGGWYFEEGTFTLPTHGFTKQISIVKTKQGEQPSAAPGEFEGLQETSNVCYRYHFSDYVPYNDHLFFGIEHGGLNEEPGDYSSVAYYYQIDKSGLELTDEIDIGNSASETFHEYKNEGETWGGSRTLYFEGDNDGQILAPAPLAGPSIAPPPEYSDQSVTDDGRTIETSSSFKVNIDASNSGVKLRRLLDYGIAHQQAEVYVDGVKMQLPWYTPGENTNKRWLESDYEIPYEYTIGKSELTIDIKPSAQSGDPQGSQWSEYYYWVYSYTV